MADLNTVSFGNLTNGPLGVFVSGTNQTVNPQQTVGFQTYDDSYHYGVNNPSTVVHYADNQISTDCVYVLSADPQTNAVKVLLDGNSWEGCDKGDGLCPQALCPTSKSDASGISSAGVNGVNGGNVGRGVNIPSGARKAIELLTRMQVNC